MTINHIDEFRLPGSVTRTGSPVVRKNGRGRQRLSSVVAWITLLVIFFPTMVVSIGGVNFTAARFALILFSIPALRTLLQIERRGVASDFFAISLATWMVVSSDLNGGFQLYVGAEALEFLGAYLIGRAFFFGPANFRTFVQGLKGITVVIIVLALLDNLSGGISRWKVLA